MRVLVLFYTLGLSSAFFAPPHALKAARIEGPTSRARPVSERVTLFMSGDDEALAEARRLIALAKSKLSDGKGPAPTSLSPAPPAGNHVKEKTDRGLIADSDAMVRDSNAGEWVSRGIDDMFVDVTEDSILIDDEADEEEIDRLKKEKWAELRDRDVTKSVMGLKRQLHAEDFEKIFERRNPRIGER
mmetsp:Transcript_23508/g.46772  ORF Transcript_23508/g.46772 Transcript_23508/m.46772 type:complete len:187 (-) Transcript_23508:51-611(-)